MRLTRLLFLSVSEFRDPSIITKDILKLRLFAGHGGNGIPRYNGIGGNGGSIFLRVNEKLTFKEVCQNFDFSVNEIRSENGERSLQTKLVGRNGSDYMFEVPFDVECVDETSMLLARCTKLNKRYLIAKGGSGGCAENNYKGNPGDSLVVFIHLKLRPNVGFLGFPNAGKSTLLKALIPEKPVKIANYPFTTLKPQICYLKFKDDDGKNKTEYILQEPPFTLSLVDLPGIIEGASKNHGVGHAFLKHLEYSEIIAMVVDVHGFQLSSKSEDVFRTPLETIALLNREAETYSKKLINKKFVLVLNKIDINEGDKKAEELKKLFYKLGETKLEQQSWYLNVSKELRPRKPIVFEDVIAISAKNGHLNNLADVFKSVHEKIHPRKHFMFEEELYEKNNKILF